ncbi:MAG: hypothetical protein NTZ84_01735 [Candidatus Nealsonbacteria bacterium]|nr:hypothetical protein [Candidatus Nealsonbacteria bacterium]
MPKLKIIKLNKIKKFLIKSLRTLAEHSFLTFLALFIISLALGVMIFFQFNALVESPAKSVEGEKSSKVEEKAYQKIKEEWDRRSIVLSGTELQKYPNPFLH